MPSEQAAIFFRLSPIPPDATSYDTSADAGEALFAFLRSNGRGMTLASVEFLFSIWPPRPMSGGPAPGWIVEYRQRGVSQGWICDGRRSGPYTFPPGAQQRL